jgi:aspartate/methionine/tyrosine aminotransferase
MARAKDYSSICASAPSEYLATVALRNAEELLTNTRDLLRVNLALLRPFMDRHRDLFDWIPPQAGPVTFPTLRCEDPDNFARRVREEAGILLVPGTVFDADSREIRLGFGRAGFPRALECFDRWLRSSRT